MENKSCTHTRCETDTQTSVRNPDSLEIPEPLCAMLMTHAHAGSAHAHAHKTPRIAAWLRRCHSAGQLAAPVDATYCCSLAHQFESTRRVYIFFIKPTRLIPPLCQKHSQISYPPPPQQHTSHFPLISQIWRMGRPALASPHCRTIRVQSRRAPVANPSAVESWRWSLE